jgi:hypothetical protein
MCAVLGQPGVTFVEEPLPVDGYITLPHDKVQCYHDLHLPWSLLDRVFVLVIHGLNCRLCARRAPPSLPRVAARLGARAE